MDTIETVLRHLVSIPTVTDNSKANQEALTYVADYVTARGMAVAAYEFNGHRSLVATTRLDEKRPRVMLYAHIDVVAAQAPQWQLQKRDGKYYGRGVFDMKFAIAVYLVLVDELQHELSEYDFGIMIVSDEEYGGVQGTGTLVPLIGYEPQVCIMPDGGEGWNIEAFAKGYFQLKVETHGVSVHGSRPWEGDNALVSLMSLLHALEDIFPTTNDTDVSTMSIGYIRGGHVVNQIPDHAEAGLDVRFTSAEEEILLLHAIETVCTQYNAHLTVMARGPAVQTDLTNPLVRTFMQTVTEVTGKKLHPYTAHGATDAGFFAEKGVPCIISSPDAGNRHGADEWIDSAGVDQYKTVLKSYIRAVAKRS
jgi:succinyl-diaminopimelate desuccinylase